MNQSAHWEQVYSAKGPEQMSWFQAESTLSLALIQRIAPDTGAAIIDVGAGASMLVDGLVAAGYHRITVLDLSIAALTQAQQRQALSQIGSSIIWRHADVLTADLPPGEFSVWHDRAVFHFLIDAADRVQYVAQVRHAVRAGGFVLVATFAEDGPTRCSGLDVVRYSADALHREFGSDFRLLESGREEHTTPWGANQSFTYCLFCFEPHEGISRLHQPT